MSVAHYSLRSKTSRVDDARRRKIAEMDRVVRNQSRKIRRYIKHFTFKTEVTVYPKRSFMVYLDGRYRGPVASSDGKYTTVVDSSFPARQCCVD